MNTDGLSVLILAGGHSQRMGQDKVWMTLGGVSLVERVVASVLPVAGEILFSANAPVRFAALADRLSARGIPARVVADHFPEAGPLAGIHAGLIAARHDLLVALAADLPFVNTALIRQMIDFAPGFDAVVPRLPRHGTAELIWEPLHALYRRRCAPAIAARLAAGERRVVCFLPDIRTRPLEITEITPLDPDLRSFFNINTPEDWRRALEVQLDDKGLAPPGNTEGR